MAGPTDDLVTQLIQRHATNRLRTYEGNLAFVAHIIQSEWLPRDDEPAIQQHLETLRRHLTESGHPENDNFLLRLGLCVPGMQRGIVPPLVVLEPNRGGFSTRRQREAEGQIYRLREALAIGRRFVPRLSPNTQEAIAELLDLSCGQSVPSATNWLGWFGDLVLDQAEQLAERAIECLDSGEKSVREIGTQILQNLACFRRQALTEACCDALIERRVFWPSSLYRDSGEAVAGHLLSLIEGADGLLSLDHLLLALAWTRSTAAHEAFRQWALQPPGWASELNVRPEEYLPNAGWCLDSDGQRRDLTSKNCFRLMLVDDAAARSIRCRTRIGEQCPSCGGPLAWLFDFSRVAVKFFQGEFAEAPRKVLCCLHCSCFQPVFTTYQRDGVAQWHSGRGPCEVAYVGTREACVRSLDKSPCAAFACAEAFAVDDASILCGIPMWLQDAEFPRCIECGQFMTFLAQHDNGPLGEEGIYYAFFCARCHVAAVTYQQT